MKSFIKSVILLTLLVTTIVGYSQKGTGENKGVSRQELNSELLELEGTIETIESGPCKYTTGKSVSGTHLIIKLQMETLNIHLGPTAEVSRYFNGTEGEYIAMIVFRTNKLPEDHYIAKEIILNGQSIVLRDEDLRPVWAGNTGKKKSGRGRNN